MPEFIADHAASNRMRRFKLDSFTVGYLECAEWLAQCYDVPKGESDRPDFSLTDAERERCRGWTVKAVREARRDCREFQRIYESDLATYYDCGYDESQAGHDYFLSRNGHGAGFFDRGDLPAFNTLQQAAELDGERCAVLYRNRLIWEG